MPRNGGNGLSSEHRHHLRRATLPFTRLIKLRAPPALVTTAELGRFVLIDKRGDSGPL